MPKNVQNVRRFVKSILSRKGLVLVCTNKLPKDDVNDNESLWTAGERHAMCVN